VNPYIAQQVVMIAALCAVGWCVVRSGRELLGEFREIERPAGGTEEHPQAGR
jgi:hypothetical protein